MTKYLDTAYEHNYYHKKIQQTLIPITKNVEFKASTVMRYELFKTSKYAFIGLK